MKNQLILSRKTFLSFLFLSVFFTCRAGVYYFSSAGDDARTATEARNPATPWRSIEKLNAVFSSLASGDTVCFRRGDTFYGTITVNASGTDQKPIVLAAYGTGERPVITGLSAAGGWSAAGDHIWETSLASPSMINVLLFRNRSQLLGRYPNADAVNGGYLSYESYSTNTSITDQQLASAPDWSGGEVVIRKNRWVLDRNTIVQHDGHTISYTSGSGYHGSANYGYFIQNHPAALDRDGEWYYKKNEGKLGIYAADGMPLPGEVKVATLDRLLVVQGQAHLVFKDLCFMGSNLTSIDIDNCSAITMEDCQVLYSGNDAVSVANSSSFSLLNSVIAHTGNIACEISNGTGTVLRGNTIRNTGTRAGMGKGDSGSYEAILCSGDGTLIELNTIDSTGYIPITFNGNSVSIRNNFINHFALVKDDGGGIYTWNNGSNAPVYSNRQITGNIVLNGIGAGAGTDNPSARYAHGIYIDDNSSGIEITGNTVASCAQFGVYIHNSRDIGLRNNTAFNNFKQLVMEHDHLAPSAPVSNILSRGNIFFSKTGDQMNADYKTIANDLPGFGNFDSNYYCRPIDDRFVVYSAWQNNGSRSSLYDLEGWKSAFNKDRSSKRSPVAIHPYLINSITSANQFGNGSFNANIGGLYAYSAAGNCQVAWSNTGVLDGGALKVSFNSQTGDDRPASVILNAGSLSAGKNYILKFSMAGGTAGQVEVFLRQSLSPYQDLSPRKLCPVQASRAENEYWFQPAASEANASIVFDIREQVSPLYFDNIQLVEANVTPTNPDDSIRFEYNSSPVPRTVTLNGNYVDPRNVAYAQQITLAPFTSAVLIKQAAPQTVLPTQFLAVTAEKINRSVDLKWSVATTHQALRYSVERSSNGQAFTAIGEVPATGGAEKASYVFRDTHPLTGKNYYRIRQHMASGTVLSRTVLLFFAEGSGRGQNGWLIGPNPAGDRLNITFAKNVSGTITVSSMTGAVISTRPVSGNETTVNLSSMSKGIYLVGYAGPEGSLQSRFVKE